MPPPSPRFLSRAIPQLAEAGVATPRLDAELLLAHVLKKARAWLWTYPEHRPTARQLAAFQQLLARRLAREPLAYLLGEWELYGRPFSSRPTCSSRVRRRNCWLRPRSPG